MVLNKMGFKQIVMGLLMSSSQCLNDCPRYPGGCTHVNTDQVPSGSEASQVALSLTRTPQLKSSLIS